MGTRTPNNATSTKPNVARPRPFYRLHASTWLLLTPFVLVIGVIVVPGTFSDDGGALYCEQGWPWTYLRREIISAAELEIALENSVVVGDALTFPANTPAIHLLNAMNNDDPPDPDWTSAWAWRGGKSEKWQLAALVGDIATALLILACIAAIFERPRRRHTRAWQFSLGELGCAIAIVAVAFGWWRSNVNASLAEAAFTKQVENGMSINFNTVPFLFRREYVGPKWLRHLVGHKRLIPIERITELTIRDWRQDDPSAELLACKSIKTVKIKHVHETASFAAWLAVTPSIRDVHVGLARMDMLESLCRSGRLTSLSLSNWQALNITDADLAWLKFSPQLRNVDLAFSAVTDDGMRHLLELSNLRELDLADTKVTDAGIKVLTELIQLEKLNLSRLKITDEGLRELGKMKSLTHLMIDSHRITDEGLASLTALSNLTELSLAGVLIEDEGLAQLQKIQSLRELTFDASLTSYEAREEFSKALPKCKMLSR